MTAIAYAIAVEAAQVWPPSILVAVALLLRRSLSPAGRPRRPRGRRLTRFFDL